MAEFHKGFVFECDVSDLLTIEGNPISVTRTASGFSAQLPPPSTEILEAETRSQLAKNYIDCSEALKLRLCTKKKHVQILGQGREEWNRWRRKERDIQPMLACLDASDFEEAALSDRDFSDYDFSYANLTGADLKGVCLKRVNFHQAILAKADLSYAHLENANFCRTDLYETTMIGAHLTGANLQGVQLARTNLKKAHLAGVKVYGLSAWDLEFKDADQKGLTVRYRPGGNQAAQEEEVEVDSLDLAAFMYLTLHNENLSRVVDEASHKWVLLLGRFSEGKKADLKEIKRALKDLKFIPIIFDFPPPERQDLIETIMLLAGMSAFVIADITEPRSTPMELYAIASSYAVPIVPVLWGEAKPFATLPALRKFRWVRCEQSYSTVNDLIVDLPAVIKWAGERHHAI